MSSVWFEINELKRAGVVVDYAIGGAVGATFYVEPLETADLDVFVLLPESDSPLLTLTPLYNALVARGYAAQGEHVIIEGMPVQFLGVDPLSEEAVHQAIDHVVGEETVRVMRPEHLIALMVKLNRAKDRIRVAIFLQEAQLDQQRLHEILHRHGLEQRWAALRRILDG